MAWVIVGLGVALALSWAGAGAAVWYLDGKLKAANEAKEAAIAALAKEEQSRKGFQASAASCTAGTAALEARAKAAEDRYAKQKGISDGLTAAVHGHIQAMLNRPRLPGEDECAAMKRLLNEEVDRRHPAQ